MPPERRPTILSAGHAGVCPLAGIAIQARRAPIRAWRMGDAAMPEEKFLGLVDILAQIDPSWTDKASPPARTDASIRVVVVDDQPDNVDTMLALLQAHGFDAKGCYDSLKALDCVLEHDPDAVILDLRMPGKTGIEVARDIRERIPGKRPTLIALSAEYTRTSGGVLSGMAGFDHFFVKPADINALVAILEKTRTRS